MGPSGHRIPALLAACALLGGAPSARAQSGYYNLDGGRPVRVEDATVIERYALEIEPLPIRAERSLGAVYRFRAEPHLSYGILPRTQVEVGLPLEMRDVRGIRTSGLAGVELSAMHNFNNEARFVPAFALWAGTRLPVGAVAPKQARVAARGIMTRTLPVVRLHVNAEYSTTLKSAGCDSLPNGAGCPIVDNGTICFSRAPIDASCAAGESSRGAALPPPPPGSVRGRWVGGVAIDHVFPLRSLLVAADVFAERDASRLARTEWTAESGARLQLGTQTAADVGVGRHFTGGDRSWFITAGFSIELALRPLMRGL